MIIRRSRAQSALLFAITLLIASCGRQGTNDTPPQPAVTLAAPEAPAQAPSTPTATLTAIVVQPLTTTESAPVSAPVSVSVSAPETSAPVDLTPLVDLVQQEMATQSVPGLAVAIMRAGVPLLSQGFGLADVAAKSEVTPATLFRIGSITKPLTAIALMQLVEAGKVDLDAPVVTYLPDFAVSDQITVRQLLSHSSGLGDDAVPHGRTDPDALAEYVKSLTPAAAFAPPGTLFSYSNTGFNILGRIIEVVSGMSYVDYMSKQLFPALGMEHTTFSRAQALNDGLALGYYPARGAPELVDRDPDNGAEYPSGFAFSNVEDLSRLASFLMSDGMVEGKQILSPASVQAMKTPVAGVESLDLGSGLGLLIRKRNGETTVGHNGSINGYTAAMELMPSQELAVIVLSNRNNYDPERIMQAAFDLLVAQPAAVPTPGPAEEVVLDPATLDSYAGRYVMSSSLPGGEPEEVTVAVQDGHLTASLPQVTFAMRPVGNDVFDLYPPQETEPAARLAFVRDASGAIQYMSFTMHALMKR